jgi:hypothetical protein
MMPDRLMLSHTLIAGPDSDRAVDDVSPQADRRNPTLQAGRCGIGLIELERSLLLTL